MKKIPLTIFAGVLLVGLSSLTPASAQMTGTSSTSGTTSADMTDGTTSAPSTAAGQHSTKRMRAVKHKAPTNPSTTTKAARSVDPASSSGMAGTPAAPADK